MVPNCLLNLHIDVKTKDPLLGSAVSFATFVQSQAKPKREHPEPFLIRRDRAVKNDGASRWIDIDVVRMRNDLRSGFPSVSSHQLLRRLFLIFNGYSQCFLPFRSPPIFNRRALAVTAA